MESLRSPDAPRPHASGDQMTQHPPGYYALLAGAVKALGLEGASPESMVLALRLLSLVLLLPIPLLCVLVARRLGLPPPVRVVAAFFPAGWIQFTHLGATINNGTLLILASSLAVALLIPIAQGDVRIRRALAAGTAVSLGLATKGFALALLATLAVAYIGAIRAAGLRATARSGACAALMVLPGLAWWIMNFARHGQVQPSPTVGLDSTRSAATLGTWGQEFGDTFSWTLWGALGWAETRLPTALHLTATAMFILLLLAGTWILWIQRRRPAELLVLHSLWAGPLAIVAYGSAKTFLANGQVRAAQGRYVHVAIVAFAVLTVVVLRRLRRPLALFPAAAATVAAGGLVYGYRHFWAGSVSASRWDALTSWWPGATALAVVAALLAAAGVVVGTAALARLTAQQPGVAAATD
jgi:4-amino-4-deoxy-L-arabinose transferase-like glycosyltransferase